MDLNNILDSIKVLAGIVGLVGILFFYFQSPRFKTIVTNALKVIPTLLPTISGLVKDDPTKFDAHDALVLLGRVSEKIKSTISDPENKVFEDVKDEVFSIVKSELVAYKDLPGVPDLSDPAIEAQVRVVFESIQRLMNENTA